MADHNDAPKSFTKDVVFRSKYINEALNQGMKFGSNQFRVYHQLRWFEEEGDYKWNVASYKTLGEYINLSEKEVRMALDKLRRANVVQHILTDKRWYRAKTDLWATTIALKERGIEYENMQILDRGKLPELPKTATGGEESATGGEESATGGEALTSVITGVGNIYINNNEIENGYAYLDEDKNSNVYDEVSGATSLTKQAPQTAYSNAAAPFAAQVEFDGTKDRNKVKGEFADANRLLKDILAKFPQHKGKVTNQMSVAARRALSMYSADDIIRASDGYLAADWVQNKSIFGLLSEKTLAIFVKPEEPELEVIAVDDPDRLYKSLARSLMLSGVKEAQDPDYWKKIKNGEVGNGVQ